MSALKSGELFAGVGGLGMAVDEVFDAEAAWFCEFDSAPSKVLAHRHPGVPNYGDATKVDWTTVQRPNILAGGFPCQDVSLAGRRRGMTAGTRSGLWSEYLNAIDVLRPDWVVIENVRGLLSADGEPWHDDLVEAHTEVQRLERIERYIARRMEKWSHDKAYVIRKRGELVRIARQRKWAVARFNSERRLVQRVIAVVLGGLADLGFDAEWVGLRAADVGAPHGRFRVFVLAWPRERTVADDDRDGFGRIRWGVGLVERDLDGRGRQGASPGNLTLLPSPIVSDGTGGSKNIEVSDFAPQMRDITKLLPTPDAYSGSRGGSQDPEKRRDGGHTVSIADVAEHSLLGTPRASQGIVNDLRNPIAIGNPRGRLEDQIALMPTPSVSNSHGNEVNGRGEPLLPGAVHLLPTPNVAMAEGGQTSRSGDRKGERLLGGIAADVPGTDWGIYAEAISRWEAITGRPAPAPVRNDGKGGKPRLNPELTEWMMGWPLGWVTASVIGLTRQEQLKACGNGVVPQQAAFALRLLLARPGVPAINWGLAA